MNRLATIAAAAAACSIGITPALAHDGWRGGYRYYAPHFYGPYWRGPVTVYPSYAYYPPYTVYAPPPPVVVERYYEVPRYDEPPIVQRRYEENEPPVIQRRYAENEPAPAQPPATSRPATPTPMLDRYTLSAKELFGFDEATIRGGNAKLDEIAQVMKSNPAIHSVRITGYTDRIGSDAYNLKLSQRRANAVKAYLVAKGIEASRLQATGKGKADPVVECHDKDRAKLIRCLEPNRRVEVERIVVERTR